MDVGQQEKLKGSIAVRQSKENYRELDVKISYHLVHHQVEKKQFTQLYKVR
jgi:hypothetical protein